MKKVAVLTGIRSEYDILYSPLRAIQAHPDLDLEVIISGAHLSPRFGFSARQILEDGFPVSESIESLIDSDLPSGRIKSASIILGGLVQTFSRIHPDFVLVCGDREEVIMGALAAVYMNIPVAHIAGGDLSIGNIDDSVRHAVTKLAHIHFPFTEESAERIRRLGEEEWRIHRVGNPGLDRFNLLPKLSRQELSRRLDFDITQGPLVLLIQHSISSQVEQAVEQMRTTLDALQGLGYPTLIGYPNSDAGGRAMIRLIDEYAVNVPTFKVYRNLPRVEFASLVQTVDVLVGNSSMGVLEAPFLKLPAVTVGTRQLRREHSENIQFVEHEAREIQEAVRRALFDEDYRRQVSQCTCPFGDGHAGERIAEVLGRTPLDRRLLVKDWTY